MNSTIKFSVCKHYGFVSVSSDRMIDFLENMSIDSNDIQHIYVHISYVTSDLCAVQFYSKNKLVAPVSATHSMIALSTIGWPCNLYFFISFGS